MTVDHDLGHEDIAQEAAILDRLAEQRAELQAHPPVIPRCPSWCLSKSAVHPFGRDGDVHVRSHEAYVGDIVTVDAVVRSDRARRPSEPERAEAGRHRHRLQGEAVTSDKARALATDLQQATDVLKMLALGCPSWCAGSPGHLTADGDGDGCRLARPRRPRPAVAGDARQRPARPTRRRRCAGPDRAGRQRAGPVHAMPGVLVNPTPTGDGDAVLLTADEAAQVGQAVAEAGRLTEGADRRVQCKTTAPRPGGSTTGTGTLLAPRPS